MVIGQPHTEGSLRISRIAGEQKTLLIDKIIEKPPFWTAILKNPNLVGDEGLEPPTSSLSVTRSNQLS